MNNVALKNENICKFCLSYDAETLIFPNHSTKSPQVLHLLEFCVPDLDLNFESDSKICTSCENTLNNMYTFRGQCLQTEEKIQCFMENCNPTLDLRDVVECFATLDEPSSGSQVIICRTCLCQCEDHVKLCENGVTLNYDIRNMLKYCVPEMKLDLTSRVVLCYNCVELIHNSHNFKRQCLNAEKLKNAPDNLNNGVKKEAIEVKEEHFVLVTEEALKNDIKTEYSMLASEQSEEMFVIKTEIKEEPELKYEIEKVEIKPDPSLFLDENDFKPDPHELETPPPSTSTPSPSSIATPTLKWFTCPECSYQTKWKQHLIRHQQVHKGGGRIDKSYSCRVCEYTTRYKHALTRHLTIEHGTWFQCSQCEYQTKWKRCFNEHLQGHKGETWFQCEVCEYKTKWKYHLNRHMFKHQP